MPKASTQAINAFNEAVERCGEGSDQRQFSLDIKCLFSLVRDHKEAAYAATELKCIMAQHQPNYLKVATYIAWAYKLYFKDTALIELVKDAVMELLGAGTTDAEQVAAFVELAIEELEDQAVSVGAQALIDNPPPEMIGRMVMVPTKAALPGRAKRVALQWWQETNKSEAICDNCSKPIPPGEGYMMSGRQWVVFAVTGDIQIMEIGDELFCETCSKDFFSSR